MKIYSINRLFQTLFLACFLVSTIACSHSLKVKNLETYSIPTKLGGTHTKPIVGIMPFDGQSDELFYFNAMVEKLNVNPGIESVRTDYIPAEASSVFNPDIVLKIDPKIDYSSSGWNFLINFPGFLIFTPAWNGYVYNANITTSISIQNCVGV